MASGRENVNHPEGSRTNRCSVQGGLIAQGNSLVIALERNAQKSTLALLVALPWLKALAYAAFEAAS